MTARVILGKPLADVVRAEAKAEAQAFHARHGRAPGLDVVLVGDDPASVVYTRSKEKASNEVGIRGTLHALSADTTEEELERLVDRLNDDDHVDGILVQLPLPKAIREQRVLDLIRPDKDVDGFHPTNVGLLVQGRAGLVPCTPLGCMRLLEDAGTPLEGARAVVVGRSHIVGRPMAQLLLARHATVTIAHSRTKDLPALCREADVLVVAVGKAGLVRGDWIKPGATVLDVGITRVEGPGGKAKLVGDVAFDEAKEVAGAITPVPGGVGPMTIAYLLKNTVLAATRRVG